MTKLNYIFISIIIVLTVIIGWFYLDYERLTPEPPKNEPTENEKILIQAVNQLDFRIKLMERFITESFPSEVSEFNEKIQKGEIK